MFKDKSHKPSGIIQSNKNYKYLSFGLNDLRSIPQLRTKFTESEIAAMEVVANVFPFKTNNYVIDQLIDWDRVPDDPMFKLTFPQKEMLIPDHFELISKAIKDNLPKEKLKKLIHHVHHKLNPHPAGQVDYNVAVLKGRKLPGIQHKYRETVLFFPKQGQTCHAYCTFCFRWPQFIGDEKMRFALKEFDNLIEYLKSHDEVTDLLFTGGDPMVMKTEVFGKYIDAILDADIQHLKTLRIGTKSLSYWPYRFVGDSDADKMLKIFEKVVKAGKHLAIMAHVNHYKELRADIVNKAVERVLSTGAVIRGQSPIFRHINDTPDVWATMWEDLVSMKCIPYYMFVPRNTGAQHYFQMPLVEVWNVFRAAYNRVSGLSRTVRGPIMSCLPGKIQVLGVSQVNNHLVMILMFIQGRKPDWVQRPFFAEYNDTAVWFNELKPAFREDKFFFEDELYHIYEEKRLAVLEGM